MSLMLSTSPRQSRAARYDDADDTQTTFRTSFRLSFRSEFFFVGSPKSPTARMPHTINELARMRRRRVD
jgi:hypothetical protein